MNTRLLSGVSIALGIIGFCAVPMLVGIENVLRTMGQVGWPWGLLFVANTAGTSVFPALGWWLLMRAEGLRVSLWTAVQANLMGFPIDFVVPSAYLGGEPLKTFYVARVCQVAAPRVLATVIVAKCQELAGLLLGMSVATALLAWSTDDATWYQAVLLSVVTILLAILLGSVLYAFASRLQPMSKLLTVLAQWRCCQPYITRFGPAVAEVEQHIYLALTRRVQVFLLAQALTCLSTVSLFMRPWLFWHALPGPGVSFKHLCGLFVLTNLVNVLTVVPGALGWFEATMAGYTRAVGIGDDKGMAFALLTRVADVTWLVLGSWLILHYGLTQIARKATRSDRRGRTECQAAARKGQSNRP